MSPDITPVPRERVLFVRAADFATIYANNMRAGFSPFDIFFFLGVMEGPDENSTKFKVEERAKVVMSPLEAKVALIVLEGAVKNYESQFGKIVIPSGLEPTINTEI